MISTSFSRPSSYPLTLLLVLLSGGAMWAEEATESSATTAAHVTDDTDIGFTLVATDPPDSIIPKDLKGKERDEWIFGRRNLVAIYMSLKPVSPGHYKGIVIVGDTFVSAFRGTVMKGAQVVGKIDLKITGGLIDELHARIVDIDLPGFSENVDTSGIVIKDFDFDNPFSPSDPGPATAPIPRTP